MCLFSRNCVILYLDLFNFEKRRKLVFQIHREIDYDSNDLPSVPRSLVNVEAGQGYGDGTEELIDAQEIAMQRCQNYFCGVSLLRDR